MRQKKKYIFAALFLMMILASASLVQGQGELLRLHFQGTKDGESTAGVLKGLQAEIFFVAEPDGTLTEEFQNSKVSLKNFGQQKASAQREAAAELETFACRAQIKGKVMKTDDKGDLYLEQQPKGIYLIAPQSRFELPDGAFLYTPFLLALPADGVEEISVKTEWKPDDGSGSAGNNHPGSSEGGALSHGSSQKGNVKTGDETPLLLLAGVLWLSAVTITILTARKLKKLKDK